MKYTMVTRLSIEECKLRLRESIRSDTCALFDLNWNAPKMFDGKVKRDTFWVRPPGLRRDGYAPIFHGKLTGTVDGTVIEGKFRLNRFSFVFITAWELGIMFGFIVGLIARNIEVVLVCTAMTMFMVLLVLGGAKKRKQMAINFIIETLQDDLK